MQRVEKNPSTAQTAAALIADPGDGWQVMVHKVYISSDTALTVSFTDGTSNWIQYVGATGGEIIGKDGVVLLEGAASTALTYTTSVDGNVFLVVWYSVVKG
jgi:hypothetical protein